MMNTSLIFSLILFIINPLVGTILSCLYLAKNEKVVIFVVALMAAICAYNIVPYDTMDLATHYRKFEDLASQSYSEIFDVGENILLYFYMKTLNVIGINKEWMPFTSTFIGYYLLLSALKYVLDAKISSSQKYSCYMLWFISISFLSLSNGIRSGLSVAFFIYSLVSLYHFRTKTFILFSILSILMHSFIAPVIILLIICNWFHKLVSMRILKVIIVISILVSLIIDVTSVIEFFVQKLSFIPKLENIYRIYVTGDRWGGDAEFNLNAKIAMFLTQLPYYLSVFVILFSRTKDTFYICAVLSASISLVFSEFWVISERYQYVSVLCTVIYLLSSKSEFYVSKKLIILMFYFMQLIAITWLFYRFRYVFIPTISFVIYPFLICFIKTVDLSKLIKV